MTKSDRVIISVHLWFTFFFKITCRFWKFTKLPVIIFWRFTWISMSYTDDNIPQKFLVSIGYIIPTGYRFVMTNIQFLSTWGSFFCSKQKYVGCRNPFSYVYIYAFYFLAIFSHKRSDSSTLLNVESLAPFWVGKS